MWTTSSPCWTPRRLDDVCIVTSESGAPLLALLFAASHPERVRALALYTPIPSSVLVALGEDRGSDLLAWGSETFAREDLETAAPTIAGDVGAVRSWAAYLRAAASPGSATAMAEQWSETDVRDVLPLVRAPTLVITRPRAAHLDLSRPFVDDIKARIPDARSVELAGRDLPYWIGDRAAFVAELEEFFTGTRSPTDDGRRGLATVLFTDIVGSTARAGELGDEAWNETRERHDEIARRAVERHGGREVKTLGDGFLITFDGPARGVRCARDIVDGVFPLGVESTGRTAHRRGDLRAGRRVGHRRPRRCQDRRVRGSLGSARLVHVKELVAGSGLSVRGRGGTRAERRAGPVAPLPGYGVKLLALVREAAVARNGVPPW